MIIGVLWHIGASVLGAAGVLAWLSYRKTNMRRAWYGVLAFLLASVFLISEEWGIWFWGRRQFFVSLGNWQAIFSSGSATLAVILYLAGRLRPQWWKGVLQSFLMIFKVIWVGFGLLVVSELGMVAGRLNLVRLQADSTSFLFGQIMVALIMLNGVYIGKRIGFGLITLLKSDPIPPPDAALARKIAVSGSISIVSWYALLFATKRLLDAFSLGTLTIGYLGVLAGALAVNTLFEVMMRTRSVGVAPPQVTPL